MTLGGLQLGLIVLPLVVITFRGTFRRIIAKSELQFLISDDFKSANLNFQVAIAPIEFLAVLIGAFSREDYFSNISVPFLAGYLLWISSLIAFETCIDASFSEIVESEDLDDSGDAAFLRRFMKSMVMDIVILLTFVRHTVTTVSAGTVFTTSGGGFLFVLFLIASMFFLMLVPGIIWQQRYIKIMANRSRYFGQMMSMPFLYAFLAPLTTNFYEIVTALKKYGRWRSSTATIPAAVPLLVGMLPPAAFLSAFPPVSLMSTSPGLALVLLTSFSLFIVLAVEIGVKVISLLAVLCAVAVLLFTVAFAPANFIIPGFEYSGYATSLLIVLFFIFGISQAQKSESIRKRFSWRE